LLRILILGLAILAAPLEVLAHAAVEPVPVDNQGWADRQAGLNRRVAEAGKTAQVIFVGDSITAGWEGAGKDVWSQYYAKRNAINLGIGGDQTQNVLWRLEHGNLDGLQPKVAVVMIGTNNVGRGATDPQVAEGVAAVVNLLRAKMPTIRVLLLAILPRGENPNLMRGDVLQVNQIIQKLADDRSVFWLDFGAQFVNADGTIPQSLMPDFLHPDAKGYQIWAEAMEDKLAMLLGERRNPAAH